MIDLCGAYGETERFMFRRCATDKYSAKWPPKDARLLACEASLVQAARNHHSDHFCGGSKPRQPAGTRLIQDRPQACTQDSAPS